MDRIKDFFENLVENHLGAMIAAILVFVALIAGAIVLSLKISRRKKERAEREYKEELSRISKEELDNIAGNVSNPEVLYKSFETAETTETKPLADDDKNKTESEEATASPSSEIEPAAPADESANYSTTSVKDETPDDKSSEAANETNPAPAESKEGNTEAEPAPQEIKATNEPAKPAPSAKTAAKSASKSTAKPTVKTAATKSATAKSDKPINATAKPTAASKPTKAANPTAKTDGNKAANKPAATSVTKTAVANKVAAASTKPAKVAPLEQKPAQAHKQAYAGKWVIVKGEDGKYYAKLLASNGGVLLKTENYSSLSGVKNGIQTIKKNVDGGNFATSIDKYGHYCFKLFSMSNRLICQSEDYSSKAKCESGINSVKRFAKTDLIINEID